MIKTAQSEMHQKEMACRGISHNITLLNRREKKPRGQFALRDYAPRPGSEIQAVGYSYEDVIAVLDQLD